MPGNSSARHRRSSSPSPTCPASLSHFLSKVQSYDATRPRSLCRIRAYAAFELMKPKSKSSLASVRTHFYSHAVRINALRVFWTTIIIWGELGAFYWSVRHCKWPSSSTGEVGVAIPANAARRDTNKLVPVAGDFSCFTFIRHPGSASCIANWTRVVGGSPSDISVQPDSEEELARHDKAQARCRGLPWRHVG